MKKTPMEHFTRLLPKSPEERQEWARMLSAMTPAEIEWLTISRNLDGTRHTEERGGGLLG
jgi:hypothetical protein